jgi:pimeloyl-ACP methyl ester carboxylesterase
MGRSVSVERACARVGGPSATHEVSGGDGIRLHACEWGDRDGPSILLIHGWSQSQLCWSRQIAGHLADRFRIVTFDNRGHGMSEKPLLADRYTNPRLWADDVAAIIDQTGLDRPVLVAWSYGGFIVSDYVRAHGTDAIAGINFVGAAVTLRPPTFDHFGAGLLANAEGACSSDLTTSIVAMLRFLRAATTQPLAQDDWDTTLCANMIVPPEVRHALISRNLDNDDVLSALAIPVLVTHGRSDNIVLESMAEHIVAVCATAQPSWYDHTGHMPFLEDADRFNRELADFVASVNKR